MKTKKLGRTGVLLPEVGIGTWDYRGSSKTLRSGVEAGAVFIDTAESYGTELVIGDAARGLRDRVFIGTKVSPENFRRSDLHKSVDSSLLRLGIDSIDLLQLHRPNPSIPLDETMGAMSDLVDAGKVRFCGVSNFSVTQLMEAQRALGKHPVVSNQVRYNLVDRSIEKGLLPYCQANGITVIAYSPLAKGLGRIIDCDPTGAIPAIAAAAGKSVAQVVINWLLCKDGVIAIPKANSEERLLENCSASGWHLTSEQIALLDTRIRFRHRNRFDAMARQFMPRRLQNLALQAASYLPPSVRSRFT